MLTRESYNIPSRKGTIRIPESKPCLHTGPPKIQILCLKTLPKTLLVIAPSFWSTTALGSLFQSPTTLWGRTFPNIQPDPFLKQLHTVPLCLVSVTREQRSVLLPLASFSLAWEDHGTSAAPHMSFSLDPSLSLLPPFGCSVTVLCPHVLVP